MSRHNITSSKISYLDETGNSNLQFCPKLSVQASGNCGECLSDCWIKIDQLDVTSFIISLFTAQYFSYVISSILRSLRFICCVISWVILFWFDVCWCYGVVWLGWCGIRMQAEALPLTCVLPAHYLHTSSILPLLSSVTETHVTDWPLPYILSYIIS